MYSYFKGPDGKKKSKAKCFSRARTTQDINGRHILKALPGPHTHKPDPFKGDMAVMRDVIKVKCEQETSAIPSLIIKKIKASYSPVKHIYMPSDKAMTEIIRR